jgi:hypothetical protein
LRVRRAKDAAAQFADTAGKKRQGTDREAKQQGE